MKSSTSRIGYSTAVAVVVANMIGTGVFTSLGFQVLGIRSGFALLLLWGVGAVVALCGALTYGELAAALPRSGGEYHYLSRIYHPTVGFLAGWVSVAVGFAAPIALAAMALGEYAAALAPLPPRATAIVAILAVTLVHTRDISLGTRFQIVSTAAKILLIGLFILAGLWAPAVSDVSFAPTAGAWAEVFSSSFAVSLIYVSYAFSGWNAAVYMAGEVERPDRVLPRALLHGTLLVGGAYVLLNYVFLRTVPLDALAGHVEVGALSAVSIFGPSGGALMSGMLCLLLVSTISAMVLVGPRVVQTIAEDLPALGTLAARTERGVPRNAVLLQQAIAVGFVLTGSFDQVLSYAGFVLGLCTMLAAAGVYVLRRREPELERPYRTWGYPFTPALFIVLSLWTLVFVGIERPLAAAAGLLTVALGWAISAVPRTSRLFPRRALVRAKPAPTLEDL